MSRERACLSVCLLSTAAILADCLLLSSEVREMRHAHFIADSPPPPHTPYVHAHSDVRLPAWKRTDEAASGSVRRHGQQSG